MRKIHRPSPMSQKGGKKKIETRTGATEMGKRELIGMAGYGLYIELSTTKCIQRRS